LAAGCCARAARGKAIEAAAEAAPRTAMSSRRLIDLIVICPLAETGRCSTS
jgi:hypothetical protein